jgi:electron transfer flavoprotein alpha subunit
MARSFAGNDGLVWVAAGFNIDWSALGVDRFTPCTALAGETFDMDLAVEAGLELRQRFGVERIFLPDNTLGRELAGRLALAADVVPVFGLLGHHRGRYVVNSGGSAVARPATAVATVISQPPAKGAGEACRCRTISLFIEAKGAAGAGLRLEQADRLPLEEAPLIFCAGDGVGDLEAFQRAAGACGASFGATRVVCDRGRMPRARQIGASGRTVRPDVYIAFGLSGAPQHMQGVQGGPFLVAVNTSVQAPIMAIADIAIAAPADAVLAALIEDSSQ